MPACTPSPAARPFRTALARLLCIAALLAGCGIAERPSSGPVCPGGCGTNEECLRDDLCVCKRGFRDCDGSAANGCETAGSTCPNDPAACPGGCGPNQECVGDDGCACRAGFRDCDGLAANGCETVGDTCEDGCVAESAPALCIRLTKDCGEVVARDNCEAERTVQCGECTGGKTCGAGRPNVCGSETCTPETNAAFCARAGRQCGAFTGADNCGGSRTVECGPCGKGTSCYAVTGQCVAGGRCAGTSCTEGFACNPATGTCETLCPTGKCGSEATCVAATGECRPKCEGVTCSATQLCKPATGLCVPKCEGVTCSGTQTCDPATGLCQAGAPGPVGSACTGPSGCLDGATCLTNELTPLTFPGGFCTFGCSGSGYCPDDSLCVQDSLCFPQCGRDADCRDLPYRCLAEGDDGVCWPQSNCTRGVACSPIGADCAKDDDCVRGARCIPEVRDRDGSPSYTGFDGGYCLWSKVWDDDCPAGSTAILIDEDFPNDQVCLKSCATGNLNGCGQGETCSPLTTNTAEGVCWPVECAVDSDCPASETCDVPYGRCISSSDACFAGSIRTGGRCERTCTVDSQCGPNAVCETGKCVGRCTPYNKQEVCGAKTCNASGHCQ